MKKGLHRNAKVLIKASIMSNLAAGLFYPLYAIFVGNIGGDLLDMGIAFAIFSILTGIFIIVFDRTKFFTNHLRIMVPMGYLLMAVSYFSYSLINTPIQLFAVQILLGFANGVLEPAWDGVFSANMNEKDESRAWATWSGSVNIIFGIAALIGGFIVTIFSFKVLFITMGIFSLLATIISTRVMTKSSINLNNRKTSR